MAYLTVIVTNTTSSPVRVDELYVVLGPTGSTTAAQTIARTQAQLDAMVGLKALLHAGTVTVDVTSPSDNEQAMALHAKQVGIASGLDVTSVATVTQAVIFADPFHTAVTPNVRVTSVQNAATGWKGHSYARSVTNTGFTAVLDVTTATGTTTGENPSFSPAENGALLGPFTATLANIPLTSAALTLHWLESAVAKSATLTGTTTLGGANAANLSAASINRTSGALSITFAMGHAPDTNSITVDYVQTSTADIHWSASY